MFEGRQSVWVYALSFALLAVHPVQAQSGKPELRRLDVAGHSRVYTAEALGGPRRALRPILVELHGTGTDVRENLKNRFFPNFTTVSNIDPVIIVRPQGANRVWDLLPAKFEDWRRLSGTDGVQVDDVAFLRAVLADVIAKDGGDPKRVFLYGISVGGQMVTRVACEMAGEFRAVAAMLATALVSQLEECADAKPIPFLLIASKTDPSIPYGGFKVDERYSRAGAEDTVANFVRRNGCQKTEERAITRSDPNDGMTATLLRHSECTAGAEVLFYRLDGSAHALPSRIRYDSDRDIKINRDLETAQELWSFFKRHMD
jgi:polyhydroxybutyrate depolymerase